MSPRSQLLLKSLIVLLVCLLLLLQVRLWVSEDGYAGVRRLGQEVEAQRDENEQLGERNERLEAEVQDLKRGFGALEERARADLGLVDPEETFYVIGESDKEAPSREAP